MKNNSWNEFNPTPTQIRDAHEQWAIENSVHATHFLTLTFDGGSIAGYIARIPGINEANHPKMIERYMKSMRRFRMLLNKRLYGNKSRRFGEQLLLIPFLEGISAGRNPHFHCLLGVTPDRYTAVTQAVLDCWARVDFAGIENTIDLIYDQGCAIYCTKEATSLDPDRPSIDWINISKPVWSRSTAE